MSYSLKALQPHILQFLERYPGIQLESIFDDSKNDLIAGRFHALIRIGDLDDSTMVTRQLHSAKCLIVAAPAYLARHGTPEQPTDLSAHKLLHYSNMSGTATWPFQKDNELLWQKVHPRFTSNNGEIIRAAAIAAHGVAYLPEFLIRDDLKAKSLVAIMTNFTRPDLPISIV